MAEREGGREEEREMGGWGREVGLKRKRIIRMKKFYIWS